MGLVDLFPLHLAAAIFLTGIIWFVQIVHYPLFAQVSPPGFTQYELTHTRLTSFVVVPGMFIEAFTAVALFWSRPAYLSLLELAIATTLLLVIWISTFFWQVPQHRRLSLGFDPAAHRTLVRGNWLRTIAWTVRSIVLLAPLLRTTG